MPGQVISADRFITIFFTVHCYATTYDTPAWTHVYVTDAPINGPGSYGWQLVASDLTCGVGVHGYLTFTLRAKLPPARGAGAYFAVRAIMRSDISTMDPPPYVIPPEPCYNGTTASTFDVDDLVIWAVPSGGWVGGSLVWCPWCPCIVRGGHREAFASKLH